MCCFELAAGKPQTKRQVLWNGFLGHMLWPSFRKWLFLFSPLPTPTLEIVFRSTTLLKTARHWLLPNKHLAYTVGYTPRAPSSKTCSICTAALSLYGGTISERGTANACQTRCSIPMTTGISADHLLWLGFRVFKTKIVLGSFSVSYRIAASWHFPSLSAQSSYLCWI